MSESWHKVRTENGWEIRDENGLLVALVPDIRHERERDAARIAGAGVRDVVAEGLIAFANAWAEVEGGVRAQVEAAVKKEWGVERDIFPDAQRLLLARNKLGGFNEEVDQAISEALATSDSPRR